MGFGYGLEGQALWFRSHAWGRLFGSTVRVYFSVFRSVLVFRTKALFGLISEKSLSRLWELSSSSEGSEVVLAN